MLALFTRFKFRFLCLLILFCSSLARSVELSYLSQAILPYKMNFAKTKIGGLSGLYYDSKTDVLYAISDDRGLVNEPRFYQFKIKINEKNNFSVEPAAVTFLNVNKSALAHQSTRSATSSFAAVLDLEGISMAPWGDMLITNEGDMNHKPRVEPQLIAVKTDGTIVKKFEIPDQFLPEQVGVQKKGVQNNLAFEGLSANPNGRQWLVACEAPLLQDDNHYVRFIEYTSPEAWVLKPGRQWAYTFDFESGNHDSSRLPDSIDAQSAQDVKKSLVLQKGISEVLFIDEHQLLVLERGAQISTAGLAFTAEIYLTDIAAAEVTDISSWPQIPLQNKEKELKALKRELLLDFATLKSKVVIDNFEGMTLGPLLADGRQTVIMVSDDNFSKQQKTVFLLFAISKNHSK